MLQSAAEHGVYACGIAFVLYGFYAYVVSGQRPGPETGTAEDGFRPPPFVRFLCAGFAAFSAADV